ncbi:MAG: anaerobic ribonucleoside-triphosphate reductase activating protein [Lachnospiraceae bacterium]|nr:anaerobic ribonucleoside-triphosphate reductase activating protein [Lachnospiraceae bacterium]
MKIYGFQKTTLLDYPGHIASTIFFGGCNFRCPYCHNSDLIIPLNQLPCISEEEIFSHLKKRQQILDGVCITGGEPTLQTDLDFFLEKIKKLGYKIKLDTNGSHPEVLKSLCEKNLLDYVAMDIKHAPSRYDEICNTQNFSIEPIMESVSFLLKGTISYEFRTTVAKELHTKEDFEQIGRWIAGANTYYLQAYRESDQVLNPIFSSYTRRELEQICSLLKKYLTHVEIRGIDE